MAAGTRALDAGPHEQAAQAAAYFEAARRWAPDDPEIDRALARAYVRLGQPLVAIDALDRAYRLRPGSVLIQQELAEAYEAAGQAKRATAIWAALGIQAGDMLRLGEQERKAKHYASAQIWYQRAIQASPKSAEPFIFSGRAYREAKQIDQSLAVLQRAVTVAPDDRDGWYELGLTQAAREEWQLALGTYRRAIDAPKGKVGRSVLYVQIGYIRQYLLTPRDVDQAWAAYEQALSLDDYTSAPQLRVVAFYQRGLILAAKKRWAEAAASYQQALKLDKNHYRAMIALADAQWQLGQHDAAKTTALDAIERDPKAKEAYNQLGRFYQEDGDAAKAREMYAHVLTLDPKDAAARKALEALP